MRTHWRHVTSTPPEVGAHRQKSARHPDDELEHALVDGNERLAWLATVVFLVLNGVAVARGDEEAFALVMGLLIPVRQQRATAANTESHPAAYRCNRLLGAAFKPRVRSAARSIVG